MNHQVSYLKLPSKLFYIKNSNEGWLKEKIIIDVERLKYINIKLQSQDVSIEIFLLSIWTLLLSKYNDEMKYLLNVKNLANEIVSIIFTLDDGEYFNEFLLRINNEVTKSSKLKLCEEQYSDDNYIIRFVKNKSESENNHKPEVRIYVEENNAEVEIYYDSNVYDKNVIIQLNRHFEYIISQLLNDYNTRIGSIEILSNDEKNNILISFNNTILKNKENSINALLAKSFIENKEEIAVEFEKSTLTYQALDKLSTKEAFKLRSIGIVPGDIVGIVGERSLETIVCVIGVIKSGACFLPIDDNNPMARIKYMLENSNAKAIYNISNINSKDIFDGKILETPIIYNTKYEEYQYIEDINEPNDLLAIIYTSGSTGNPKGVMITHINYLNISTSWGEHYELSKYKPVILQFASFSFAVFLGEIGRAFVYGGRLVICSENAKINHIALYKVIEKHKVNMMESTPSLMIPFMEYVYNNSLSLDSMKLIAIGSELFPIDEYEKMIRRFGGKIRIVNAYGATETTIDSSYYDYDENITYKTCPPIGKPMQNTKFYILDRKQHIMPIGCMGELYIAGDGVTSGYLNNSELTNEKFAQNPFNTNEKMYSTGDLGMWLPGGIMYLHGRKDDQVEIRGHRVELGEINSIALKLNGIDRVVTAFKIGNNNNKYLCLYYISECGISVSEIKQYLELNLPIYMLPDFYVNLDVFPLNKSGKIDRYSLPIPKQQDDDSGHYILTIFEMKVLNIISNHTSIGIAGLEKSLNRKLKEIGINSISFIEIIVELELLLEIEFSVDDLNNSNYVNLFMFLEYVEKLFNRANSYIDIDISI